MVVRSRRPVAPFRHGRRPAAGDTVAAGGQGGGPWREELDRLLATNAARPNPDRLRLMRIFEELRALGYDGGDDAVRRYAAGLRADLGVRSDADCHSSRKRTVTRSLEAFGENILFFSIFFYAQKAASPASVAVTVLSTLRMINGGGSVSGHERRVPSPPIDLDRYRLDRFFLSWLGCGSA